MSIGRELNEEATAIRQKTVQFGCGEAILDQDEIAPWWSQTREPLASAPRLKDGGPARSAASGREPRRPLRARQETARRPRTPWTIAIASAAKAWTRGEVSVMSREIKLALLALGLIALTPAAWAQSPVYKGGVSTTANPLDPTNFPNEDPLQVEPRQLPTVVQGNLAAGLQAAR